MTATFSLNYQATGSLRKDQQRVSIPPPPTPLVRPHASLTILLLTSRTHSKTKLVQTPKCTPKGQLYCLVSLTPSKLSTGGGLKLFCPCNKYIKSSYHYHFWIFQHQAVSSSFTISTKWLLAKATRHASFK